MFQLQSFSWLVFFFSPPGFLIKAKQATLPPEVKLPPLIAASETRQNVSSRTLEKTGPFSAPPGVY